MALRRIQRNCNLFAHIPLRTLSLSLGFLCFLPGLTALPPALDGQQGPSFVHEPPSRVEFPNNTGIVIPCSAQGQPVVLVAWTHQDGTALRDVAGLRHVRPDGSLVFPPFSAQVFRRDVHDAVYKCVASNAVGTVGSRDVHVKAVVQLRYKVQVYDEFVVHGNTAVLRCQVPNFVQEYISFVSWKRDDGLSIASTLSGDRKYSILSTGELYIRDVSQADGLKSYSCQTRHRLTGELTASTTSGRLFVTERPHGDTSPKITDTRPVVSAREGDNLELACAATSSPPPTYRWYREEEGEQVPLVSNHRITLLDGSLVLQFASVQDSGKYLCVANNSVGEDRTFTILTVSAPLSVYITPQRQIVDVGRSATFNCSVSGHPLRAVHWVKDLLPIVDVGSSRMTLLARDVLHIPSVSREDRGMYQCFAFNDLESAQSSAELRLGDVAPVMLSTFPDDAVRPRAFVSLRCSASGNPLPQVTWTLDGIPIPEAIRYRTGDFVTADAHVVSYVNISDIRVEDGGEYACSAANAVATVRHAGRIHVYGPPVVKQMRNVSVVAGHTLEVRCPVSGYPLESVAWIKDGATLPINHRQKIETLGKLTVQDVQRASEEGLYTCIAEGSEGKTATGNLYVQVRIAPLIDAQPLPETKQSNEGMKVKLMCSVVQGDSPVHVTWTKNGHSVLLEKDVILQNLEDSSILVFRKINFRHSGNYTCAASNIATTVNRTVHLVVNVPPRWIIEPKNSYVVLGQKVTMDCVAEGYPHPRMYWKKAKGKTAGDFRDVLSSYRRQVFDNGSLVLQEVEESDGGHYLCKAANSIGAGLSKVIFLTIHTPPKFDTKFFSHTVPKGKDAQLACEAKGELPINIKWEKDKQPMDLSSIKRLSANTESGSDSMVSRLTIVDVGRPDSALYTCLASNKFGEDETNIQLVVQEPPSPPIDVGVKEKSSRSVVLSWTPAFSGNSPVTKYIVQHGNTTVSLEEHLTETGVPGTDTSVTIRGLLPASPYHFRVIASNVLGQSEPSDFINVVTDEEVPGGPPLEVEVRPTGSQSLKVTWKPPRKELQYGAIQGYYIGYKIHGSDDQYQYKNVESTDGQQLSYLTNLRRLTKYTVIVQAYNNVGAGPRSDEVTSTTLEAAPPTSPVLVTTAMMSSSITVSWERHQDDTIVKDYILHYKPDGGEWMEQKLSTNTDRYTLEGLRCGTRYRLYMTASNSLGMGEPSETIITRTKGAAPVSPQRDAFLLVNSTMVTLLFGAWQSGGCPITHFSVHFRFQRQWKAVSDRVDANEPHLDIRHLAPATEYTLRVSAHSEAGTTEAEYRFHTLNITIPPPSSKAYPPLMAQDGPLPFYKNLTVLLPVVISVAVLLVVIITVIVCLRRQADSSSSSGDSRKGRNCENMGLAEFPPKSIKDVDPYGKSSYYSSPSRKPIAVASSSNRENVDTNHEYAEPYTTVPAPRCVLDDADCGEIISIRPKSEGPYATVKRSPPRSGSHFSSIGQAIDMRVVRQMTSAERQEICNNSSSSQSGASGGRRSSHSSDGYRPYRQGNQSGWLLVRFSHPASRNPLMPPGCWRSIRGLLVTMETRGGK